MSHKQNSRRSWWTFAITSLALFMVTLDNLVVTTAIPVIREDLHAGISGLEWTVNAYTLTFAVLLLTGAALGDRFGRRRMFAIGIAIFTAASAAAALAPTIGALDAARAVQGLGGAIVMPLTLTILSAGVPEEVAASSSGHGAASAASPSPSARWSAAPSSAASPGTGSSGSTSPWGSRCSCRSCRASPRRRGPSGVSICAASCSRAPACSGSCGGSSAATRSGGAPRRSSAP